MIPDEVIIATQHAAYQLKDELKEASVEVERARANLSVAQTNVERKEESLKRLAAFLDAHNHEAHEDWFEELGLTRPAR